MKIVQNIEYCALFRFKNSDLKMVTYLGHNFGFFKKFFVMVQNHGYLLEGISNYTNEKNDNIHGLLGLVTL